MKRLLAMGLVCLTGCFGLPPPDAFSYATPAEQAAADALVAADAAGDASEDGDAAADGGDGIADGVDAGEDVTAADALDVQLADAPPEVGAADADSQTSDAGTDTAVADEAVDVVDAADAVDVVIADLGPDGANAVDALADATDASIADAPDLADLVDGSDTAGTDATLADVVDADDTDPADAVDVVLADDASASDADAADGLALPDANTDPCAGVLCPAIACKTNSCDPTTGQCVAVNLATGATCEDGSLCTSGDQCINGSCFGGGATNCNDGNACTDDGCAPATGCAHVGNNANACSDANVCTADVCLAGACSSTAIDADGDGYGAGAACGGDCNDGNAAIHPGAVEVCNLLDDNCNSIVDDVSGNVGILFYADADADGEPIYNSKSLCKATGIYTYNPADHGGVTPTSTFAGQDCDDNPQACGAYCSHLLPENRCDGWDNNCNLQIDEGCDDDSDDFCDSSLTTMKNGTVGCATPPCWPLVCPKGGNDCDDTGPSAGTPIHPGAAEVCNNIDDNCNGQTDDGLGTALYYADADGDGYGAGTGKAACGPLGSYTAILGGDCNDASMAINPGATEICGDSIDNNCNSQIDEGCPCAKPGFATPACTACLDGYVLCDTNAGNVCAPDQPIWGARPLSPGTFFTDNGDGTISDSQTGLLWQKGDNGATVTWSAAHDYCKALSLAGYADWRWPTLAELDTLIDFNKISPAVPTVWAGSTASDFYWSAVPLEGSPTAAWPVVFSDGYSHYEGITSTYRVRCVR